MGCGTGAGAWWVRRFLRGGGDGRVERGRLGRRWQGEVGVRFREKKGK